MHKRYCCIYCTFLNSFTDTLEYTLLLIVFQSMATETADVYAAGDIVEFPLFSVGGNSVNIQHWQMAHAHGR